MAEAGGGFGFRVAGVGDPAAFPVGLVEHACFEMGYGALFCLAVCGCGGDGPIVFCEGLEGWALVGGQLLIAGLFVSFVGGYGGGVGADCHGEGVLGCCGRCVQGPGESWVGGVDAEGVGEVFGLEVGDGLCGGFCRRGDEQEPEDEIFHVANVSWRGR